MLYRWFFYRLLEEHSLGVLQDLVAKSVTAQTTPLQAPAARSKPVTTAHQPLDTTSVPPAPLKDKTAASARLPQPTAKQVSKTNLVGFSEHTT